MIELDEDVRKDLFILLCAVEDRIPNTLYALKIQLEKEIYQKYSILEVEEMREKSKVEYGSGAVQ